MEVGIHTIVVSPGASEEDFEKFMVDKALPAAAEVPGSVNREGRSAIKSQHLLKTGKSLKEYCWVVKSSGVFGSDLFSRVFARMLEEVHKDIESFANVKTSAIFAVVTSFDAGPRDLLGRPEGDPQRDTDL